ncbi:MAG: type IV pilus secretin PilQ [Mariprofundales bacterium]|nr:type IV pilus secretin PilQ [Mariprofundales bacterium]
MNNTLTRVQLLMLVGVALLLSMPVRGNAASLTGLTITTDASGDLLTVQTDAALPYQVFDLSGPPRLVLNFPATSVGKFSLPAPGRMIQAVRVRQKNGAAEVEVTMARATKYVIKEQGKLLKIRFPAPVVAAHTSVVSQIDDLSVVDHDSVTELHLLGSDLNLPVVSHIVNHGLTMTVDMPKAHSNLTKEHFSFPSRFVRSATIGNSGGGVRLVLNLLKPNPNYQIHATSGELVLRFANRLVAKSEAVVTPLVERIAFHPEDRVSHILLTMGTDSPIVDIQQRDHVIKLTLAGLRLKKGLERTMDVSEFPGDVQQIDAFQDGNKVRVNIRLRDKAKVSVSTFQRGKVLSVNIEPEAVTIARAGLSGDNRFFYTGDKVTFDFTGIDVVNALRLIAKMSNLNIIMSDGVSGKLTMRLIDVPWDQALDLILTAKGLGQEKVGNVLRIAPIATLRTEYKTRLALQKGSQALEPLVTEFITLNYTKVASIKAMIASAAANATKVAATAGGAGAAPAAKAASAGILSSRGSILTDNRTNTLIIKDTQASIDNVKRLIAAIDQPVRQVLITARVVDATDTFSRDVGIQWGGTYKGTSQSNFPGAVTVNGRANTTGGLIDLGAGVGPVAGGGAIGLALGTLNGVVNLDLALSAAELNGSVKVVSNPRIITTNLKPASITQGTNIAVVTPGTTTNPATTTYVPAMLSLTVTPQITSKNTVLMALEIHKDSPVSPTSKDISTKTVTTNVNVKSGETVVIGGIYERAKTNSKKGVPGLSSIPILGWLFQRNTKSDNRAELLIFITPQILPNTVTGGDG